MASPLRSRMPGTEHALNPEIYEKGSKTRQDPPPCVGLSAPKSQRFLRFAIAMPIADPRNPIR